HFDGAFRRFEFQSELLYGLEYGWKRIGVDTIFDSWTGHAAAAALVINLHRKSGIGCRYLRHADIEEPVNTGFVDDLPAGPYRKHFSEVAHVDASARECTLVRHKAMTLAGQTGSAQFVAVIASLLFAAIPVLRRFRELHTIFASDESVHGHLPVLAVKLQLE